MKERPILFNGAMVRAILDERKTQTRRVMKNQPMGGVIGPVEICATESGWQWHGAAGDSSVFKCPFGQPSDRLWVRETWQGPLLSTAGDYQKTNRGESINNPEHCVYRATDLLDAVDDDGKELGWRPSIHMPRWASRINLEITSVRVERLNDISEDDAMAEGVTVKPCKPSGAARMGRDAYAELWESINGPGSWDANPWVWAVEFRRTA